MQIHKVGAQLFLIATIFCVAVDNSQTSYYQHNPYGANTYAFGFEVNDTRTGNVQFREERRYGNGQVSGSYGFRLADGRVTVTRFNVDRQRGLVSDTATYEADGERAEWRALWPTKRPGILVDRPASMPVHRVHFNEEENLNETNVAVPPPAPTVPVEPAVLNLINGRIPLQADNHRVGFKILDGQNALPPELPLVPFQMPHQQQQSHNEHSPMGKTTERPRAKGNEILPTPVPLRSDSEELDD